MDKGWGSRPGGGKGPGEGKGPGANGRGVDQGRKGLVRGGEGPGEGTDRRWEARARSREGGQDDEEGQWRVKRPPVGICKSNRMRERE